MVGYKIEEQHRLNDVEHAIAGAFSGIVTRLVCQPLDVLKIRFQLQVEPISKNEFSKYSGMFQAVKRIVREENIFALWKGHVPAQYLSISYGISQFVSFEILTKYSYRIFPDFHENQVTLVHFICGTAAGGFATVCSFPFDVVRTRLVAQGEPKVYKSVFGALSSIYMKEGPLSLYKGLGPTVLQAALQTGFQFGFYQIFSTVWNAFVNKKAESKLPIYGSLGCASLAGICSKFLIYPLDVAKKRLQIQGFEGSREGFGQKFKCTGLVNCIFNIVKYEGFMGLYKGLVPSLLKAAATTGMHLCAYEEFCHLLRLQHSETYK